MRNLYGQLFVERDSYCLFFCNNYLKYKEMALSYFVAGHTDVTHKLTTLICTTQPPFHGHYTGLQCFDSVGWAAGRASGL